ncbi:MAG: adenylosuccinate synthase [Thermoanaerobaculum sp.]|nr:adenylosuccinate synthase [Thermoanaerobaculum sp.]MDW7968185.1 adenylosuccinate synthase [Thermoanaerobaculum sp.]
MANVVVVGGQWGDEGKGKVVDLLCPAFRHVVRFNGGNNAGHTVRFADRHFALHLIPSGILHENCQCFIGPGVVVDPVGLLREIEALETQGIPVRHRLYLSPRAHLVLPHHRALDQARERAKGRERIGTTGRGIGPTYETRAARTGLRAGLARHPGRLRQRAEALTAELNRQLTTYPEAQLPSPDELLQALDCAERLSHFLAPVDQRLHRAWKQAEAILFEGAQGTLLDVDFGTYPFVTSSGCLAGFAAPAVGLPARAIDGVLGVFKAYCTRVGAGPFPTEIPDALGDQIRRRGNEFGTTTGRPRRTGWFDAVAGRAAVRWSGIEAIALTKLDVLDSLATVPVAVAYRLGDRVMEELPDDAEELAQAQPVYEELPGWQTETTGITDFSALPARAQAYVHRLEELLGVPIVLISTGPRREETILRSLPPLTHWLPS